jgi:ankyrin repeat protein
LLLDAGADPNDGQTLYNRHFRPDDGHFEILFAYGLGQDKGGPWFERLGERLPTPAAMLAEELWSAARHNLESRVRLLVEHGAPVDTPGFRDGRTPYEAALFFGNLEIAQYLLRHGAKAAEVPLRDRFAAACLAGRRSEAEAFLRENPNLLETLGWRGRVELVHRAVEANRLEGVRLLAGLGFELGGVTDHDGVGTSLNATPLHNAAWGGHLDMVRLLVELGADPNVRDPTYDATPLGWAQHNHQEHVAAYLISLTSR